MTKETAKRPPNKTTWFDYQNWINRNGNNVICEGDKLEPYYQYDNRHKITDVRDEWEPLKS